MDSVLLDLAGHRRWSATMPGYHRGRPSRNKGEQYPADPPTVEEIAAVMSVVGDRAHGHRLRALVVVSWRAGLRISEALWRRLDRLWRGRLTDRGSAPCMTSGLLEAHHPPGVLVPQLQPRQLHSLSEFNVGEFRPACRSFLDSKNTL